MWCQNCGTKLSEQEKYCKNCGTMVQSHSATDFQSESNSQWGQSVNYDYHEFYKRFTTKRFKGDVKFLLFLGYFNVVLAAILMFVNSQWFNIIDVVFLLVCTLVLQKTKKSGAALAMMIYCVLGAALMLLAGESVSGGTIICFIVALAVTKSLKKLKAAYEEYQVSGKEPQELLDEWNPLANLFKKKNMKE